MSGAARVSRPVYWFRRLALALSAPLMPCPDRRLLVDHPELGARLVAGKGTVLLINHFSRRDPAQALALLFSHPDLVHRPVAAPVSYHQFNPAVALVCRLMGVIPLPVVNEKTPLAPGSALRRGHGLKAYLQTGGWMLARGGIVLLAPQGGRRPHLGDPPRGRPVRLLLQAARRHGTEGITLLLAAFSLPRADSYADGQAGGVNMLRRYRVRLAPLVDAADAVAAAGGMRHIDEWVFEQLATIVPPVYLRRPNL